MKQLAKTIWITGGGSGVGSCLAKQFADQGYQVIVSGRSLEKLEAVSLYRPEAITPMSCDVRDENSIAEAFRIYGSASLQLDGVILAAGICKYIDLPSMPIDSIREVMDVNFMGTVIAVKAALPFLLRTSSGQVKSKPFIAGICSMSTYAGFPRAEAYGSSKAAMEYFLKSLRADIEHKVDITIIQLGFVETPMTAQNDFPMPFLMSAEKAASRIANKLVSQPRTIILPNRLHWLLKAISLFDAFWYGYLAKRMRNI